MKNKVITYKYRNRTTRKGGRELPGYPIYSPYEDIYNIEEKTELNPDDFSKKKEEKLADTGETLEIDSDLSGKDLDIPGSELDDDLEDSGSEDEENNYYSLGGDNHENLDEDNG